MLLTIIIGRTLMSPCILVGVDRTVAYRKPKVLALYELYSIIVRLPSPATLRDRGKAVFLEKR
jgi:hypothetical protein